MTLIAENNMGRSNIKNKILVDIRHSRRECAFRRDVSGGARIIRANKKKKLKPDDDNVISYGGYSSRALRGGRME
jgi:hypothetical protein